MSFQDPVIVIGHRGAAGLSPENTLPSFRRAWESDVSAVELDVYAMEGRLLVFHDDTLQRTTNGQGPILASSVPELRALDAGGGEPIPFLEEVTAELPMGTGINIELKGPGTAAPVAEFMAGYRRLDVLVSSFDHAELQRFHQLAPEVPVAPLFGRWKRSAWNIAEGLSAGFINLSRGIASPRRISQARKRGLRTLIYTVNDLAEAKQLVSWGASGLFTDYPDRITTVALAASIPD